MENFEYQGRSPRQVNDSEYIAGIVMVIGIVIAIIGAIFNWIIG